MTYQMPTAKAFISKGSLSYGCAAPGYLTHSSFRMGAGGGRAALRPSQIRKFPLMQPPNRTPNDNALVSGFIIKGTPNLTKEDKGVSQNIDQENDIFGRHFLFEKTCAKLERSRTVIPPLPRDNNGHRPANLHPFSLSSELPSIHSGRPFTLGFPRSYEVNPNPTVLFPSTFVLNSRNTLLVEGRKLSRPKVHYPTHNPVTVKDNQKSQSYPDPIVGAPHSFIHRISELSSLEGETVRQEKLKKIRKSRKYPS
ncbi:hypothetical protein ILYODFUR_000971 [Ilyodon furcidens]|uniref:Uncharacterized protein n=1 Tax=Ilyodon furcidens TaxID=33524 RepID=A0ABV0U1N5_9TELE